MTVKILCRTNLDGYEREVWPTTLPAVPVVGQRIASECGRRLGVVSLTWLYNGTLEVELHKWP